MEIILRMETESRDFISLEGSTFTFFPLNESAPVSKVVLYYTDGITPPKAALLKVYVYEDMEALNAGLRERSEGNTTNVKALPQDKTGNKVFRLSLKITKVTRTGQVTIRLIGQGADLLAKELNEEIMDLSVIEEEQVV